MLQERSYGNICRIVGSSFATEDIFGDFDGNISGQSTTAAAIISLPATIAVRRRDESTGSAVPESASAGITKVIQVIVKFLSEKGKFQLFQHMEQN